MVEAEALWNFKNNPPLNPKAEKAIKFIYQGLAADDSFKRRLGGFSWETIKVCKTDDLDIRNVYTVTMK